MSDETVTRGSGNIFADLGLPDADELLLKSQLALAIGELVERHGLSQTAAARRMGLAQPDVSNLVRGRLRSFSLERLLKCLRALGGDVEIQLDTHRAADAQHEGRLSLRVA